MSSCGIRRALRRTLQPESSEESMSETVGLALERSPAYETQSQ